MQLKLIEEKIKNKEILSVEELKNLYGLDELKIEKEKRDELLNNRDIKQDLVTIFNCDINQISLQTEPNYCKDCQVFYGNLNYITLCNVTNVRFPRVIIGNLNLKRLIKASNTIFPEVIVGNLYLRSLTNIENCIPPKILRGHLYLDSLKNLDKSILPEVIEGKILTIYGIFETKQALEAYIDSNQIEEPNDRKKR